MLIGFGISPSRVKVTGGAAFDADAQAFFTAASITDSTQKSAINQLVLDLKSYNIWTKMKALYPIVGGSASSHAVNLKTPGTFNLTFSTGWTHASTGMTPTSAYANTGLTPLTDLDNASLHISYYSRTTTVGSTVEIGGNSAAASYLHLRVAANYVSGSGTTLVAFTTTTDAKGFWLGSKRSNNDRAVFRNGIKQATNTTLNIAVLDSLPLYLAARNSAGTPTLYSSKECAFASIGDGLTDTDASNFYTAVNTYQTTLSRNV